MKIYDDKYYKVTMEVFDAICGESASFYRGFHSGSEVKAMVSGTEWDEYFGMYTNDAAKVGFVVKEI